MKYPTGRFGQIDVKDKDVITIPKGIIGFSQLTRYVILEMDEITPFKWFQSLEDQQVAFVIMDPLKFFPGYEPRINEKELEELNYTKSSDLITYVIVTVPLDTSQASANLLGPLVINIKKRLGKQAVISDSPYTMVHNLLDELKKKKLQKQKEERRSVKS